MALIWMQKVQGLARRPGVVLLGCVVIGAIVYFNLQPSLQPAAQPEPKTKPIPGQGEGRAALHKSLVEMQQQLAQANEEKAAFMREMKAQVTTMQQEREAEALRFQEQRRFFEETLKRLQQTPARQTSLPRATPPKQPPVLPVVASPPPANDGAKVRILRHERGTQQLERLPQRANRQEVAYLQRGSFAKGAVITGVLASTRTGGGLPMLIAVKEEFIAPRQLQGPGIHTRATSVPLQGCFVMGVAAGDPASQRVHVQLEWLSCVMPDGAAFEQPLKGYVTGMDGTYGIVAQLTRHDSAVLTRAFLTALIQEASAAFALTRSQLIVAPNAGGPLPFSGVQTGLQKITDFYLEQAQYLLPTLWVESGAQVHVVVQEGTALDGYPTVAPFSSSMLMAHER